MARLRDYPAAVAALVTWIFQGALAIWLPMPGSFEKYGLAATQYLEGRLAGERLMDFSPFYFHLSVWAEQLFDSPGVVLQGLQITLSAAAVGLFYHLGRRRFSAIWAGLGAFLLAVDPLLLVYQRILEPEAFQLFFLLAFMVLVDSRKRFSPWLAGCIAALCLATRPTFLPAFLAVPIYYRWRQRDRGGLSDRSPGPTWQRASLAVLLPVLTMVVLLSWRAHAATGDWRSPTMNPGTVFFEGNNPVSRGTSAIYPPVVLNFIQHSQRQIPDSGHAHYRRVARAATGEPLTPRQVNAYWSEKAWTFLRQEPGVMVDRLLTKVHYALHDFRWHDVSTAWSYESRLPLPAVPFALLVALALFGTLFEARRWKHSLLFYLLAVVQLGVMVVFYISARQRLAFLPAVIYFALVASERFWGQKRGRVLGLVATCLLALALWLPDAAMRDEVYRRQSFRAAQPLFDEARQLSTSRPAAATQRQVVEGLILAPWWLDGLYPAYFPRTLGSLEERIFGGLEERLVGPAFEDAMRFDLATLALRTESQHFEEIVAPLLGQNLPPVYRGGHQPSQPALLLARYQLAQGHEDEARQTLRSALADVPGDPFVLAEMVALDNDQTAVGTLFDYWSSVDARYLVGRAQLRQGKLDDAIETFEMLLLDLPEFRDAGVYLAAALARAQRYDAAAAQYLKVAAEHPEPILRPQDIIRLFDGWARLHSEDPQTVFYAAQILHRHGELEKAMAWIDHQPPPPRFAELWRQERRRLEANMAADRQQP